MLQSYSICTFTYVCTISTADATGFLMHTLAFLKKHPRHSLSLQPCHAGVLIGRYIYRYIFLKYFLPLGFLHGFHLSLCFPMGFHFNFPMVFPWFNGLIACPTTDFPIFFGALDQANWSSLQHGSDEFSDASGFFIETWSGYCKRPGYWAMIGMPLKRKTWISGWDVDGMAMTGCWSNMEMEDMEMI